MGWRRIVGSSLVVILVLSIALPAMCGECRVASTEKGCEHRHGAAVVSPDGASMGMHERCDSCADGNGILAKRNPRRTSAAQLMLNSCALRGCDDALARRAVIAPMEWPGMNGRNTNRTAPEALISSVGCAHQANHKNVSWTGIAFLPKSPYQPLAVSLKI
jgi:hypothetical protein